MIYIFIGIVVLFICWATWVTATSTLRCDKCGRRFVGFDLTPEGEQMNCPVCYLNKIDTVE